MHMKPRGLQCIGWLDTAASLFIGLGLGYLLLHRLEMASGIAWTLCGLGAIGKMVAPWMGSRASASADSGEKLP